MSRILMDLTHAPGPVLLLTILSPTAWDCRIRRSTALSLHDTRRHADRDGLGVDDLDLITLADMLHLFRIIHIHIDDVALRPLQSDSLFLWVHRENVGHHRNLATDRAARLGARLCAFLSEGLLRR